MNRWAVFGRPFRDIVVRSLIHWNGICSHKSFMNGHGRTARQVRFTQNKPAMRLRTGWRERFRSRVAFAVMMLLWVVVLLIVLWWAISGGVSVWPVPR